MRVRHGKVTSLLPSASEERQVAEGLAARNRPSTQGDGFSRRLDEKRQAFSTHRPGQGRRDFECKPTVLFTLSRKVLLRDSLLALQSRTAAIGAVRLCLY